MDLPSENTIIAPPSKMVEKIEKKYGPKDWEQFDQLEQKDRQVLSSQGQMSQETRKKKKKPTKKQKKLSEISEYQLALKRLRSSGQQFHNPFQKQKLNLEYMPVLKMLERAFDQESNLQQVLKKMGLKTVKILFKCGARTNIGFMLSYLKQGSIPRWVIQRHREMMRKDDREFNSDQNTLLRTMSGNNNNCL